MVWGPGSGGGSGSGTAYVMFGPSRLAGVWCGFQASAAAGTALGFMMSGLSTGTPTLPVQGG